VVTMVVTMVVVAKTPQTRTSTISTLAVVEIVVRVFAMDTAGSSGHLGAHANVAY
jgi:hypothetical protein